MWVLYLALVVSTPYPPIKFGDIFSQQECFAAGEMAKQRYKVARKKGDPALKYSCKYETPSSQH